MKPSTAPTKQQALWHFMQLDRWYSQQSLSSVGGSRFPARLFDLVREDSTLAYDVRAIDEASGHYEYRLRLRRPDEARPVKRINKLKALEAEVARLNAELSKLRRVLVPVSSNLEMLLECRPVEMGR